MALTPLSGKKIGKLLVIERIGTSNSKKPIWKCLCDCGNEHNVTSNHLINGHTKSCGCSYRRRGEDHPLWKGYGEISGRLWKQIEYSGKRRKTRSNIEFSITIEYAWKLFLEQERKCALSNLKLIMNENASLDRIDSSRGYVDGNVQWVHKDINIMKNIFSEDYFIQLCRDITKATENRKIDSLIEKRSSKLFGNKRKITEAEPA